MSLALLTVYLGGVFARIGVVVFVVGGIAVDAHWSIAHVSAYSRHEGTVDWDLMEVGT